MAKMDQNICFWEKRHFFRRKLPKLAHLLHTYNIGPRYKDMYLELEWSRPSIHEKRWKKSAAEAVSAIF
jgi:hypothetical protein